MHITELLDQFTETAKRFQADGMAKLQDVDLSTDSLSERDKGMMLLGSSLATLACVHDIALVLSNIILTGESDTATKH